MPLGAGRTRKRSVRLPEPLARAYRAEEAGVIGHLLGLSNRWFFAVPPTARPSAATGLAVFEKAWRLLGTRPDEAALRQRIARLCECAQPPRLTIGPETRWIDVGGKRVSLERRAVLRRVLEALVAAHPVGEVLGPDAILGAGWPGEDFSYDSGRNRMYVALSSLRNLGLRDLLQRHGDGWRLDPALVIRRNAPRPEIDTAP